MSSSAALAAWGRPLGSCWPSGSSPSWLSTCALIVCRCEAYAGAPLLPALLDTGAQHLVGSLAVELS